MLILSTVAAGVIYLAVESNSAPAPPPLTELQRYRLEHCGAYEKIIERLIKRNMDDPGSFEWRDSSSGSPIGGSVFIHPGVYDDRREFTAFFRGKNKFGALVLNQAPGFVEEDGCAVFLNWP